MARFSIQIDRTLCAGYGVCVLDAPHAFELDADGAAEGPELTDDDSVVAAARGCPLGAITVIDLSTGRVAA